MTLRGWRVVLALLAPGLAAPIGCARQAVAASDPLPSWRDTPTKSAIISFVKDVTAAGSPDHVPEEERIAAFDNDGTLRAEKPVPFEAMFAFDQIRALAPQHPEWKIKQPFASVLAGDIAGLASSDETGLAEIMAATHAGMSPDTFAETVTDWIATATNPQNGRPYVAMVYQPMLELLAYLRANGFKTFLVSGGGLEFVRAWSERSYGIPPEQVVGTIGKLKLETHGGEPVLIELPALELVDDKEGKPVGIQTFIGHRPLAAFGNSDGDQQMLEWTAAGPGARFALLVHHDDPQREFAYDRDGKPDPLDKAWDEANSKGWTVVSMRKDWDVVFPSPADKP